MDPLEGKRLIGTAVTLRLLKMEALGASSNKGKLVELQAILERKDVQLFPQSEFSVSDADETGLSFVENAR